MASGLGKWLAPAGVCGATVFDYDPGFHRQLCSGDFQCFFAVSTPSSERKMMKSLTVFDSGCSAGRFAKGSPHSFL